MKEIRLSDIEFVNVVVLVIGCVLTILVMRDFKYVFSFAVASAIMTLNFRFLRKTLEKGFAEAKVSKRDLAVKLPLKFLVLAGLIAIIIIYGDINVTFFLIGLSTVFLSILINQFTGLASLSAKRRQKDGA